jgi:glucose/mannose transport system substrate-binding protein
MYRGDAAMFVMGDWAKGYLEGGADWEGNEVTPFVAGTDFGVVPGLGSADYFTFNSAVFGIPKGAQHPNAARAFLTAVASPQGQEAFNLKKGSVPANINANRDAFDAMVKGAAADFEAASEGSNKLLPGYASLTTFDYQVEVNPSLLVFAVGGAKARELDTSVPEEEAAFEALDIDYILGKMTATYSILEN